jgi:hypothetical protein
VLRHVFLMLMPLGHELQLMCSVLHRFPSLVEEEKDPTDYAQQHYGADNSYDYDVRLGQLRYWCCCR